MKLSICVITMNRKVQLCEALDSCLKCVLPDETEFVIIDNASEDDTHDSVKEFFRGTNVKYFYERLETNLGVGGGRNYAFSKASGEYIYALDDDAVIKKDPDFFINAINILDCHTDVITLTTKIYDEALDSYRKDESKIVIGDGLFACEVFCGGSHFLRKSFFVDSKPYFPNKYGSEEIPTSLYIYDAGKINAYSSNLMVIHRPKNNKWNYTDERNHQLLIRGIALPYAIKKKMFPFIFLPIVYAAYCARIIKHGRKVKKPFAEGQKVILEVSDYLISLRRIKIRTIVKLYKYFGIGIF